MIFAAVLLVGGSFVFAEYRNKQSKNIYVANEKSSLNSYSNGIDISAKDIDTDVDGSKDWEEILAGTNPNDPKSKPSTTKEPVTKDLTKTDSTEKLSQIDLVSRDFFARYMELRQLGTAGDKNTQDDLAQKTINNIVLSKPIDYKLSEILVKSDSSVDAIKEYSTQIGGIFKKNAIKSRNEIIIAKDAGDNENPDTLKELDPIISSYKSIINSLIKVQAPESMKLMHLDLLNSMNGSLFIAKSLRNYMINPIEGVQAIAYYEIVSKNLFDAVNTIKSYLKYLGINENIF